MLRSTLDGSEAFLDLSDLSGVAIGDFVGVKDNHALNEPVALGGNSLISGDATGWSAGIAVAPLSLVLLAAVYHRMGLPSLRPAER